MRSGCRLLVLAILVGCAFHLTGCEDPVASMVKSSQDAAVKHHEIEAEKEMKEMEIELEREKLRSQERQAALAAQQQMLQNNNTVVSPETNVPTGTAEDTKNASVNSDQSDELAKDNGQ